jgi:hypothetical protein
MARMKHAQILNNIFDTNEFSAVDTTVDFETKSPGIPEKYEETVVTYISDKIIPALKQNIYKPRKSNSVPFNRTIYESRI